MKTSKTPTKAIRMPTAEEGLQTRFAVRPDVGLLVEIEKRLWGRHAWGADYFCQFAENELLKTVTRVAEIDGELVGFIVYRLGRRHFEILNLGVAPEHHGAGIATRLVHELFPKLRVKRRRTIVALVDEWNVRAQLFFRHARFVCNDIVREPSGELFRDRYQFVYRAHWNSTER